MSNPQGSRAVFESWSMSRAKVLGLAGALALSCMSIWVSAGFTREPPPHAPEAAGMKTGDNDVSLSPDAPQWRALKLGAVKPAGLHFPDPVPAGVKIGRAAAAKGGTPLPGRATT